MTGALPPSSRCTRLRVLAACSAIHLPVSTEPVSETMSTPSCSTIAAPASLPPASDLRAFFLADRRAGVVAAGDDVQSALGEDVGGELGHLQRRHGRRRGGFGDDFAAGGERGAHL